MKKIKNILILTTIIGLIVACSQIYLRVFAEERNKVVEIVADYGDFLDISVDTGLSIYTISNKLISSGVTSIAISEESLDEMEKKGEILLHSGIDLKYLSVNFNNEYNELARMAKNHIEENNLEYENTTIVLGNDNSKFEFLNNSFSDRFRDLTVNFKDINNNFCILIKKSASKVKNVGLGLTDNDFEFAKTLGFNNIIPRIENHEGITKDEVDRLYNQLKKYDVRTVIFAGVNVFGQDYQDKDEEILKYIGEKFSKPGKEIITAIIEKPAETDLETIQRGINSLSKYSKYVNTKVFSTDNAQLQKLSYNGLSEQWGRAISQRNVRVIYVRPLDKAEKTTTENFEDTLIAISDIKGRINHMGMTLGNAKGFGEVRKNNIKEFIISIGVIASGFLLLILIFGEERLKNLKKAIYLLIGISVIGISLGYLVNPIYKYSGDLLNKLVALVSSITFASLSGVYLINSTKRIFEDKKRDIKKTIFSSVKMLLVSAGIAVIGGIYIGAILSGSKYILKLDTFRGVKISFLLPLVIWGFSYILNWGLYVDEKGKPLGLVEQFKLFMSEKVSVKYVAIFGVVGLLLLLIVLRSGNTMTSSASSLELMFRNFLEKYLVARPRTKELVAFPILMFIPYLATFKNKEFCFFAMGASMIGIENIINSFCHIRMPVLITSLSTIYSLIFAIIIGSIGIIIIDKIVRKLGK